MDKPKKKEPKLFSEYNGINVQAGFNLKDDMKKKEILNDIYRVEGYNQAIDDYETYLSQICDHEVKNTDCTCVKCGSCMIDNCDKNNCSNFPTQKGK